MNSNNRCTTSVCAPALLAVAALGFSPAVWSLGLGDAKVESFLNQPLQARIDLISQASDDLGSVTARLASAADYELIGASREAVSVPIGFSIEDIDGDAYILATSNLPISDPVLRLIVEVSWSSGRMLREYTLFLDPPAVPEPAPAPRIDQRTTPAAPAAVPQPSGAEQAPEGEGAAPAPARAQPLSDAEYGPVRSGETLWAIARDWSRDSGMSINRAMVAIQRENPDAFLRNNINLLKRGAILRMPSMADVNQISAAEANQEVVAQEQAFTGRTAVSAASPETPLLAEESAAVIAAAAEPPAAVQEETAAAGAGEPLAEEAAEQAAAEAPASAAAMAESAAGPAPEQDVLELVPPSADSELESASGFEQAADATGGDAAAQALREDLSRAEEALITQQQQNEYLEERIRELESQLQRRDEGAVADEDLANLEDRLREQRQTARQEPPGQSKPWYARIGVWLIGLLLVAAAIVGWLFSRRAGGGGAVAAGPAESLRDIKHEAEDVLRVLADDRGQKPATGAAADPQRLVSAGKEPGSDGGGPETPAAQTPTRAGADSDAELLDEDSSDPEIQLDLARAYISMGDREAARVILQEVVNNGSEAQQAEARKMLGLL